MSIWRTAKQQIGDKVRLVGSLDDMEVVETRSIGEVEVMAAALLEKAGPNGYLLGGTASGTYTERGALALKSLVKVAESYGRRRSASSEQTRAT